MIQSPTGRLGQEGTAPASDSGLPLRPEGLAKQRYHSDPRLRPRMHRTPTYSSSSTSVVGADWDQPTGDARSVRTRKRTEQVRKGTQVDHNTEDRTLHTCRTVTDRTDQKGALQPSRHARTQAVLWAPTFALQCCGRHQLPYPTNTVRLPHMPLGTNSVLGAVICPTWRTW